MARFNGNRRRMLYGAGVLAAASIAPCAFAELLTKTPRQTQGPFYPDRLPLDTDNDLLIVNDAITPAVGEVAHLGGRLLDINGNPVRNAEIEIWQADGQGVYLHSGSAGDQNRDGNFQGYGRFLTNAKGEYYFRTIKPVPYPGRTPHIHFAVNKNNQRMLTTQMYLRGHPGNARDGLLQSLPGDQRERLLVAFEPIASSSAGELSARFDIVIGLMPEDPSQDFFRRRA